MRVRWPKRGKRSVTDLTACSIRERVRVNENPNDIFGFQANQIVLFAAVWIISATSAFFRSYFAGTRWRRRVFCDRLAYGCTAGFAAVCILGVVSLLVGTEYFDSHGFAWVCVAAGIGALGEEQHTIMRSMLMGLLQTLAKNTKDDEPAARKRDDEDR